jgi:hypothetical protein
MRVIIAGSRDFLDYEVLKKAMVESGFDVTEVVSGCARGADKLGERWAEEMGIPIARYPADWNRYGNAAGPRRNDEMAKNADALVAFPTRDSRGTRDMIRRARVRGLKWKVVEV